MCGIGVGEEVEVLVGTGGGAGVSVGTGEAVGVGLDKLVGDVGLGALLWQATRSKASSRVTTGRVKRTSTWNPLVA